MPQQDLGNTYNVVVDCVSHSCYLQLCELATILRRYTQWSALLRPPARGWAYLDLASLHSKRRPPPFYAAHTQTRALQIAQMRSNACSRYTHEVSCSLRPWHGKEMRSKQ